MASSSSAIDGGALAERSRLSQANVGIGTLVAGANKIGLSRCSGVLISRDLVVWSRTLMVHSYCTNQRMRYGPGSSRERHDD
jgi:hypothetical protein